jgi:DNA polymerase III sliding clamp (beta) subunit (PCNA family)
MKIQIRTEALRAMCKAICHAADPLPGKKKDDDDAPKVLRTSMMVHLSTSDTAVTARTANAGVHLEAKSACRVFEQGSVSIVAEQLEALTKQASGESITITSGDHWFTELHDGNGVVRIRGEDPDLFFDGHERPPKALEVDVEELRVALARIEPSIGRGRNIREHLKHAFLDATDTELRLVGTDSRELARCMVGCVVLEEGFRVMVPVECVRPLATMLRLGSGIATIGSTDDRLFVSWKDQVGESSTVRLRYSGVLVEGEPPSFEDVINAQRAPAVIVGMGELRKVVRYGQIFATKDGHVRLGLGGGSLEIYGRRVGRGEGRLSVDVDNPDGLDASTWCNIKNLRRIVDEVPADEVCFEMPAKPRLPMRAYAPGDHDRNVWIAMPFPEGPEGERRV